MKTPNKPLIIAFYSYKGGVGRTQLLANLAAYLCYYKKQRILVIDWDLEAPGLHTYLKIEAKQIQRGLIDVFDDYSKYVDQQSDGQIDPEQLPYIEQKDIIESPLSLNGGKIHYFAPGKISDDNYHTKVADFNWYRFYYQLNGNVFVELLKNQLRELPYDYIFIDSRTGINDYSGICNIQFPQINFVVMAPNQQNVKGVQEMIQRIQRSPYLQMKMGGENLRQAIIFPILSRLDNAVNTQVEYWESFMYQTFAETIGNSLRLSGQRDPNVRDYIARTTLQHTVEVAYGEVIIFDPNNPPQIHNTISISAKFYNIIQLFYKDNQENPKEERAEPYYYQAMSARYSENWQEAIKLLRQAIDLKPDYTEAYFQLGYCYGELKDVEQALVYYRQAIDLKPDDHEIWYNLGVSYSALGRYEEALSAYEKTIDLKPDHHEAWYNLGVSYHALGRYEEALAAHEKAIALKADFHGTWNNLGISCHALGRYEEAIAAYEKAIAIKADFPETWYNLGISYYDLERYEASLSAYEKAIALKPDYHEAWNNLGISYGTLGRYETSLSAFEKTIDLKADYDKAYYNIACVYSLLHQTEQSLHYLAQAIALNRKYKEKAKQDDDFVFISQSAAFQELVGGTSDKAVK